MFRNEKKPARVVKKTKNGNKKQPVEVYCRLRPVANSGDRKVIQATSDENLQVSLDNQSNQVYKFKHIFNDDASQSDVFNKISERCILTQGVRI